MRDLAQPHRDIHSAEWSQKARRKFSRERLSLRTPARNQEFPPFCGGKHVPESLPHIGALSCCGFPNTRPIFWCRDDLDASIGHLSLPKGEGVGEGLIKANQRRLLNKSIRASRFILSPSSRGEATRVPS